MTDAPQYGVEAPKEDGVANALETVGWMAVFVGVIAIGVAIYLATSSDASTAVGAVAGGGAAVGVQGLLLVGFGRVVHYTREAADYQRQTAVLLAIIRGEYPAGRLLTRSRLAADGGGVVLLGRHGLS